MEQTTRRVTQARPFVLAADSLAQEGSPMEEHTTTTEEPDRREASVAPTQDSTISLKLRHNPEV